MEIFMITLTEKAIQAVARFIASSENPASGLRIEVTDGGCSGLQYGLKLDSQALENDEVLDYQQFKVFIDANSSPIVNGMTVDFIDSIDGSGFKFTNPNAVKSCACGTSFNTSDDGTPSKTCG
jgi:iron-sulfur cluster assembly accessory protein